MIYTKNEIIMEGTVVQADYYIAAEEKNFYYWYRVYSRVSGKESDIIGEEPMITLMESDCFLKPGMLAFERMKASRVVDKEEDIMLILSDLRKIYKDLETDRKIYAPHGKIVEDDGFKELYIDTLHDMVETKNAICNIVLQHPEIF